MTNDDPQLPELDDDALAQRLVAMRPTPAPAYRGALRRRLVALGPPAPRPANLGRLTRLYAAGGFVLVLIGALSAAGIGPLAA
jgi:hypothetical protein